MPRRVGQLKRKLLLEFELHTQASSTGIRHEGRHGRQEGRRAGDAENDRRGNAERSPEFGERAGERVGVRGVTRHLMGGEETGWGVPVLASSGTGA